MEANGAVYLREMTYLDTDMVVQWRNSAIVRSRFIYRKELTAKEHESWIKNKIETGQVVQMIICTTEGDRPIGSVYIRDIDLEHHKGEYGIFIGEEDALGKGYGTEAAKLMIQYAFEKLLLHRLYLRVFADNIGAIKSYEKAGFVKEAYLRDDVCIDGEFRDIVLMAIIHEEKKHGASKEKQNGQF